jgi:hypothetical protein
MTNVGIQELPHSNLFEISVPDKECEGGDALFAAFHPLAQRSKQGLYVFLFDNPTDYLVWDNNKGREKHVVRNRGGSIKPGKFEDSFKARFKGYAKHLHRVDPVDNCKVFNLGSCFRGGVLLDLSGRDVAGRAAARVFEMYWIARVRQFIETEAIEVHRPERHGNTEWVLTDSYENREGLRGRLLSHMNESAHRIDRMMELA